MSGYFDHLRSLEKRKLRWNWYKKKSGSALILYATDSVATDAWFQRTYSFVPKINDHNHYRPHPKDDGRLYFHFVCQSTPGGGGPRSQIFGGGPRSQIFRGGPRSQIFGGGPRSQIFGGGSQVSDFRVGSSSLGGGVPRSQIFG